MLDRRLLRDDPDVVRTALAVRGSDTSLDRLIALEARRRELIAEAQELKEERNRRTEEIAALKREGHDAKETVAAMRALSKRAAEIDREAFEVETALDDGLLALPNIPDPSVPLGPDESANVEVRAWGTPGSFSFAPRSHADLGEALGILDFARAAKVAQSRFPLLVGVGAALERALVTFMLDVHIRDHGYTEVLPPLLVSSESMRGTGQLPKFAEESFVCERDDLWLIPTAEVPVTNLHRDEVLSAGDLPLRYVAYTPCFRREAGSYGRDTRGLIRQHQFNKVELVAFVHPDHSADILEELTGHAARILELLGLPYRVVALCTGDLGFSAAKTYDLEVWFPEQQRYREVSSCSNFTDFQARRTLIRYKAGPGEKPDFVHTLNGSGLAVGRTFAAILENCQDADGSVVVPEALRPYLGGLDRITSSAGAVSD